MNKRYSIRRTITWFLMVCILTSQIGISAIAEVAEGSVLRLVEMTGSVSIESQNGKKIEFRENMKLNSGNSLKTAKASYAYVSLDDTKAVKLDALSQAQIRKSGKRLEVLLESGNLFFNVTAPLAADENLNIRTSTTVTGIRGTTGYVEIKNEKETIVCLLEGKIICRGFDPVDGQIKDFVILPGQKAVFTSRENSDIPEIALGWLTEDDIPGYVAVEIKKNEELQRKITEETNLSVPLIIGKADELLKRDEEAAGAEQDIVNKKLEEQGQIKKTDPVFIDNSRDSSDKTGTGSNKPVNPDTPDNPGEPDPPPTNIITREMPISVGELNTLLESNDVVLISNTGSQMLVLDSGLLVPQGRKLTLGSNVPLMVSSETVLNVDGTIEVAEQVTNNGIVRNTSSNTFLAKGGMTNGELGSIDNTGRFVVTGDLTNSGMLDNQNRLEVSGTLRNLPDSQMYNSGTIKATIECSGRFEITEGTFDRINQTAGMLLLSGGIVNSGISIAETVEFSMSGGTVNPGDEGWGILVNGGSASITGGTVNGKDRANDAAIVVESGFLALNGGKIRGKTPKSFVKMGDSANMMYMDDGEYISGDVRFNMLPDADGVYYLPGGCFTNLGDAFAGAVSGETVMALPGDSLGISDPEGPVQTLYLTSVEPDNPVVLDLNGQEVPVYSILCIGSDLEAYSAENSAALKITDSKKTGSLTFEDSSGFLMIRSFSKVEITNCKLIGEEWRIIELFEEGFLKLGKNSLIQNRASEEPAIFRRGELSEIEFAGGTVCNEGEGPVFWDGWMIGLPKENMNTEIRGTVEDLFYCITSDEGFYIPEDYVIEHMEDGYYHVIPMSEPQQELFMSPIPENNNNAPKPASPSEADMEDMEDIKDSAEPDDGQQEDLPVMEEGEKEKKKDIEEVFLVPEPDKREDFSEGEEEKA